jgi:hypothetical protein
MRPFSFGDDCDTDGITKCLGWDTVTPSGMRNDEQDCGRGASYSLFKGDGDQETCGVESSPTPPFMAAMGQLPIEESLQYLVQSDLAPPPSLRQQTHPHEVRPSLPSVPHSLPQGCLCVACSPPYLILQSNVRQAHKLPKAV